MMNPKNNRAPLMFMLAAVVTTLVSGADLRGRPAQSTTGCFGCFGGFLGPKPDRGAVRQHQTALRQAFVDSQALNEDEKEDVKRLALPLKINKIGGPPVAGACGLGTYAVGHFGTLAAFSASHVAAIAAGTVVSSVASFTLPVLGGAAVTYYVYKKCEGHAVKMVMYAIHDVGEAPDAEELLKKYKSVAASQLQANLKDCLAEPSFWEVACSVEGSSSAINRFMDRGLPTTKVSAYTHGVYHSPLVPLHETTLFLIWSYTPTCWMAQCGISIGMLKAFLIRPEITLAGVPIAWAVSKYADRMSERLFEDSRQVYNAEVAAAGASIIDLKQDFFEYRGKVYCDKSKTDNVQASDIELKALRHCKFFNGGLNAPTFLEQKAATHDELMRLTQLELDELRTPMWSANSEAPTFAELALFLEDKCVIAGKTHVLKAVAKGISKMAEKNTAESWSYVKMQAEHGLTFPTLYAEKQSEVVNEFFDTTTNQGQLQAALYMNAIVQGGDVGCPVRDHDVNASHTWGASQKTNLWVASQVMYQNKYWTVKNIKNYPEVKDGETTTQQGIKEITLVRTNPLDNSSEETTIDLEAARDNDFWNNFWRNMDSEAAPVGALGGLIVGGIHPLGGTATTALGGGCVAAKSLLAPAVGVAGMCAVMSIRAVCGRGPVVALESSFGVLQQIKHIDTHPMIEPFAAQAWCLQYLTLGDALQSLASARAEALVEGLDEGLVEGIDVYPGGIERLAEVNEMRQLFESLPGRFQASSLGVRIHAFRTRQAVAAREIGDAPAVSEDAWEQHAAYAAPAATVAASSVQAGQDFAWTNDHNPTECDRCDADRFTSFGK